jgi:hypothetical protein
MIPPTEGSGGVGWQFTSQFGLSLLIILVRIELKNTNNLA